MNIILNFLNHQKMINNFSKTNFMIFLSPYTKSDQPPQIKLNENQTIDRVTSMKYLGLNLDPQLKWNEHGRYVESKLSMAACII